MPFKSAKQKKTIDAAAHNPAFAKKVGIKTSDAKKMSAHGKGQTKFEEAKDTVEKDEKGNVKSWKHEGDWKKTSAKQGRGKVTNLSDKARRKTEKLSKAEQDMAEAFELALEGQAMGRIEQGVWVSDPKGKVPAPTGDPEGAGAKEAPAMRKELKKLDKAPVKKASSNDLDDAPAVAEGKAKQSYSSNGKKVTKSQHDAEVKQDKEKKKFKKMAEAFVQIGRLEQMIFEAKKAKCTCDTNESSCSVHGKMKEGLKGGQKKLDVAPPKGKLTGADFKALKGKKKTEEAIDQNKDGKNDFEDVKIARLKAAAKSKSDKKKSVKENWTHDTLASRLFETDEYMMSLHESLQKKLKG
jgi:hypothetical protein